MALGLALGFSGSWLDGAIFWGWFRLAPIWHLPVEAFALPACHQWAPGMLATGKQLLPGIPRRYGLHRYRDGSWRCDAALAPGARCPGGRTLARCTERLLPCASSHVVSWPSRHGRSRPGHGQRIATDGLQSILRCGRCRPDGHIGGGWALPVHGRPRSGAQRHHYEPRER